MSHISVEKALGIVGRAEKALGSGADVLNPFESFMRAGAASRLEAVQAIQLTIADYYQTAAREGQVALDDFNEYSRATAVFVLRIIYHDGVQPTLDPADSSLGQTESIDSFVRFLRSLDHNSKDYWPEVFERIDVELNVNLISNGDDVAQPAHAERPLNDVQTLHRLWSIAVDAPSYNKSMWQEIEKQLIEGLTRGKA